MLQKKSSRNVAEAQKSKFMHHCMHLAVQARGKTGTNPLVGAVLVRDGEIIAEGYYGGPGTEHAEALLIKNCAHKIQPSDVLFVNLEPCCHHGKTPPCTEAIINAGIKHVVYGMEDPDERVAGKGIQALREAGVTVEGPVLRAECERLNRGYVSLRKHGRPYITLKKAQTTEGKVANDDGSRMCITSEEQNAWSHEYLRAKHDAILVGVGTVIADNPQLTIRNTKYEIPNTNQPLRIILDPDLRTPVDAKVAKDGSVIVVREGIEVPDRAEEIIAVPMVENHFDWNALWGALDVSSILVEGGPKTWTQFKEASLYDEEITLVNTLS